MIGRFFFGKGFIDGKIVSLDCPNEYRGIGNISIQPINNGELWTGEVWISNIKDPINIRFSSLTSVYCYKEKWRYYDDSPLKKIFKVKPDGVFYYEPWFKRATILKRRRGLWIVQDRRIA